MYLGPYNFHDYRRFVYRYGSIITGKDKNQVWFDSGKSKMIHEVPFAVFLKTIGGYNAILVADNSKPPSPGISDHVFEAFMNTEFDEEDTSVSIGPENIKEGEVENGEISDMDTSSSDIEDITSSVGPVFQILNSYLIFWIS